MVIDSIMSTLTAMLTGLIGLFPSWDLGVDLSGASQALGTGLAVAGGYFPVGTLGICLGLVLGARAAMLTWTLVKFVYDKFPFKMT